MSIICIGGANRSGTTLLQTLLCQGKNTLPFTKEALYFREIVRLYHDQKLADSTEDFFGSIDGLKAQQSEILSSFLDKIAKSYSCAHLVLKEPLISRYLPDLFELRPDIHPVVMVRDPRDVVASTLKVGRRQIENGEGTWIDDSNVEKICHMIMSHYAAIFTSDSVEFKKTLTLFRYEDLVNSPKTMLQEMQSKTGIDFSHVNPDDDTDKKCFENFNYDSQYAWKSDHYGKKVTKALIGTYKDELDDENIQIIQTECHDFMQFFNYTFDKL